MTLSIAASPILDPEVLGVIRQTDLSRFFSADGYFTRVEETQRLFLSSMDQWISRSELNRIEGLNDFPARLLTAGTTQTFDDFYLRHSKRLIRYLPGEYPYHRDALRERGKPLSDDLRSGDALIISYPFAATGEENPRFRELLEQASKLDVPVKVDCAFFGVSSGMDLDLRHGCIESVSFSLSKPFVLGNVRVGIEYRREKTGPSAIQNDWYYTPSVGAVLGLRLMETFGPDFIFTKYRAAQESICAEMGLRPSKTVLFGLTEREEFAKFDRDGVINRCCLSALLRKRIGPS